MLHGVLSVLSLVCVLGLSADVIAGPVELFVNRPGSVTGSIDKFKSRPGGPRDDLNRFISRPGGIAGPGGALGPGGLAGPTGITGPGGLLGPGGRRALLKANKTGTAGGANGTKIKNGNSTKNAVSLAIGFLRVSNLLPNNSTIFAPTDKALRALGMRLNVSEASALVKAPYLDNSLASLKYHVIPGRMLTTTDFPNGETTYTTALDGKQLKVINRGTSLLVVDGKGSRAKVVGRSNIRWNGNVVHLVDKVLLP
ncbi:Fasciclin domain-containing protein [Haematococcus lacustris]